jgi:hypothetical protein
MSGTSLTLRAYSSNHILFQFYLDDLEDELITMALQMLVKDLLILFQAGNEGVINVLGGSPFTS